MDNINTSINPSTVNSYLNILKLDKEPPTFDYLERICYAHLNQFPFENISKLIFSQTKEELPSFGSFLENYREHNYGGTCFILNSNLLVLLQELGFDCYHVMLGGVHIGIIVVIENIRYYVDCGAAAPIFKPVDFEGGLSNGSRFGEDLVQILPVDSSNHIYKYVRFLKGTQSGNEWIFNSAKKYRFEDFKQVIIDSNQIGATFMGILRCQLWQVEKSRSVSLVNNKFTIRYSNGESSVSTLNSIDEIERVLAEEFLLPRLPAAKAIEVLKTMDIDIFSDGQ